MKRYLPEGITREERTRILNQDMRSSVPGICLERARLVTESYRETEGEPYLLRRAKGLAHILEHMTIFIRPEELIVGNHASQQRFAPLYPETGAFSLKELERMPVREVDTLQITEEQRRELTEEIYPWWAGKSLEDIAASRFPEELKAVLNAPHAVFDCFSRARSGYGHYLPNIQRILLRGFVSIEEEARRRLQELEEIEDDSADSLDFQAFVSVERGEGALSGGTGTTQKATPQGKRAFYEAAVILCEAVKAFAERYASWPKHWPAPRRTCGGERSCT